MADLTTLVDEANKLNDEEKTTFLAEFLAKQNVLWFSKAIKALEKKFEVSAQVAAVGMGPAQAAAQAQAKPQVEEKVTFDVILKSAGTNKLNVIKAVRTITNLGLKEAKELVESAPKPIKQGVPKEDAEKIKKDLETAGAQIEIK